MDTEKSVLEQISNSENIIFKVLKKSFAFITNPTTGAKIRTNKKKVYLLLSPQYNNLGDHAIAMASIQVLKEQFEDYEIVEITSNYYKNFKEKFSKSVRQEDVLVIIGGGFMGDMWLTMENMVRDIICSFRENKIVILPQTVYFDLEDEKQKSKEIYSSHSDLHIMLRDYQSYELCKNELNVKNVYFVPDIVTVLEYKGELTERKDVGVCMRTDKEKLEYSISEETMEQIVKEMGYQITPCSTLIGMPYIFTFQREKLVLDKINEMGSYKFILTNRLHCMIFAYLSKTPCIAFDNKSKKVSGVYEWIKECEYIQLYDDMKPLNQQINEVMNASTDMEEIAGKLRESFLEAFKIIQ